MKIIRDALYLKELDAILDYIAKDSLHNALNFIDTLDYHINNLSDMPFKNRQSLYCEDKNTRDFIFKGYTIPYHIDLTNNTIVILDIFKWSKR